MLALFRVIQPHVYEQQSQCAIVITQGREGFHLDAIRSFQGIESYTFMLCVRPILNTEPGFDGKYLIFELVGFQQALEP
ncbi:MAG: hypothetical protein EZS28_046062 [Streblomastix strix]|uniref:Uncharacterized protein n=1 Tax=Streblomastix strix TaxID=222440 RepID=A0A5J4TLL5_9EUKA|nr:MAG: hypothetical protein EZS28_046062 [Streblomastix strix]